MHVEHHVAVGTPCLWQVAQKKLCSVSLTGLSGHQSHPCLVVVGAGSVAVGPEPAVLAGVGVWLGVSVAVDDLAVLLGLDVVCVLLWVT